MMVMGYPAYFNMVFDVPRYIHAVVILAEKGGWMPCGFFISIGD
jgi:hypothetical protein